MTPDGSTEPRTATVPTTEVEVLVIGAGITGLVSASILRAQGATGVMMVDSYPSVGGNHLDFAIGPYTFDVGSLIFQDDSPLLEHFPEILERYTPISPSWAKLTPQRRIAKYPFSIKDDVLAGGPVEIARIVASAALARLTARRMRNTQEFARYWIGGRLLRRSGLEHYIERFCGRPADLIETAFARRRMMWIAENASVRNVLRMLRRQRRPAAAPTAAANQQLARPRDGYATLYEPAVRRLTGEGVGFRLGASPRTLRKRDDGRFVLSIDDEDIVADRVVSTIPLDITLELCGLEIDGALPTVTLLSLFFSFAGDRGFAESVLYNFSDSGCWKRLTVYSDFYGAVDDRQFFTVEVVAGEQPMDPADAAADFRHHTTVNGLFDGELRLEGHHSLEHAYPIYTAGAGDRAQGAVAALKEFGLESFGRQGGFQYQSTARKSTLEAAAALGGADA